VIGWKDYTLVISFMSKGYPHKDQIEELFIVMVYCMYSQHVTSSTFSLISLFLIATYFSKARYSLFLLKVQLNPINRNRMLLSVICSHLRQPIDTSLICSV